MDAWVARTLAFELIVWATRIEAGEPNTEEIRREIRALKRVRSKVADPRASVEDRKLEEFLWGLIKHCGTALPMLQHEETPEAQHRIADHQVRSIIHIFCMTAPEFRQRLEEHALLLADCVKKVAEPNKRGRGNRASVKLADLRAQLQAVLGWTPEPK